MANRAKKSGINLDMEKKRDASYDKGAEAEARQWIDTLLGEPLQGDFFVALKDGSKLCQLLNVLQPGLVPIKFTKPSGMPFQQIDNINAFLSGCKKYGMDEKDLFVSLDLQEGQNKNMVISSLFSLGRQAQKNGYTGAVIGPKEAEKQEKQFSDQQLREGRNVASLQMGTNKVANQTGMTPYGQTRQIA